MPVSHMPPAFDPYDEDSWFFGFMSRADAHELLLGNNERGAFLVRESTTAKGDLVLSVKETDHKVSHYIIYRLSPEKDQQVRFKIGDHIFQDIPRLLKYYMLNVLEETSLTVPATPKDPIMHTRSFTKDYLAEVRSESPRYSQLDRVQSESPKRDSQLEKKVVQSAKSRKIPCKAVVIQSRIPNAYDKTALTLHKGDTVLVTEANVDGCWKGEICGSRRKGHFPFNYVKFIEEPGE